MFFLNFKKKWKPTTKKKDGLYLFINSQRWQAVVSRGDTCEHHEGLIPKQEEAPYYASFDQALEHTVGAADNLIGEADTIHLLIDRADIVFSSQLPESMRSGGRNTVLKYGCCLTGSDEVSYGQAGVGAFKDKLYSFVDIKVLRAVLGQFNPKVIPKVLDVVPVAYPLLQRCSGREQTYGALYIGVDHCTVLLANDSLATFVIRHLPVGIFTPLTQIAAETAVPIEEILEKLIKQDLFSRLSGLKRKGAKTQKPTDPFSRALDAFKNEIIQGLEKSEEFFKIQRASGSPVVYEIFGEHNLIKGLRKEFQKELGREVIDPGLTLLDVWGIQESPMACNLLQGGVSPLFKHGRVNFSYHEGRYIPTHNILKKQKEKAGRQTKDKGERRRGVRGGTGGQRQRNSIGSTLRTWRKMSNREDGFASDSDERRAPELYFGILAMLCLGLLYLGYDNYGGRLRIYNNIAVNYQGTLSSYTKSRGVLLRSTPVTLKKSDDFSDKVLWTEKFLALGDQIDQSLWLTDVYLTSRSRKVKGEKVETPVLTIEGAAMPSTEGHVYKIAQFIDDLQKDEASFMSDFRKISFKGSELDESEEGIIRFQLEAWYDKNKRIEALQKKKNRQQNGGKSPMGIDSMQENVRNHKKRLEEVL